MRLSECSTWDDLIKFTQTDGPYYTYMSIVNVAPLDKEHVVFHVRQRKDGSLDLDFHMIGICGIIMGSDGCDLYNAKDELVADIQAGRYSGKPRQEDEDED